MVSSINPSVKMIAIVIPGLILSLAFDVMTPLIFFLYLLMVTVFFSGVNLKKWLMFFIPLSVFALMLAWTSMIHTDEKYAGGDILVDFWWIEITTGSLQVGISLALRSMCFIALTLLFALTTDPTKLMLSMMQQLKLPPKLTYGILAGYRFLPLFKHELDLLRQAHQIRGVSRTKGIKGRIQRFKRYLIPLLANAIRKSERVANAMESKGFTGSRERTHYHDIQVQKRDWMFLASMVSALVLAFYLSYTFGYLNIFGKTF
ncbi:energy-coupling factor transporter transmembrane component T family protein [Aquisalibacillus elongatus]|uniref:Energy-coupling factor transport system permease protein n=1 Tax=Aquisalibacillus elongatus TaxID=485577 RepID=A0A3N5B7C7_9BACI|nr:energy-coupling factor transporter transmembrane component T [Aquisalibacillus elongatus]RPF53253.1 energy-coupling factor transport system permease protein [Aquisalibacillus elongatus]